MPEPLKIYLDQMLRLDVAQALRGEGHDVIHASEVGQARADDYEILLSSRKPSCLSISMTFSSSDFLIFSTIFLTSQRTGRNYP